MGEKKDKFNQKILEILQKAETEFVSTDDFTLIIHTIIDGVNAFRISLVSHVTASDEALEKKIDGFIAVCERQLQELTKANEGQTTLFRKELAEEVSKLKGSIESIELTPGEDGEDAELTDDDKEEMTQAIIDYFEKQYKPKFDKQLADAIAEAVKKIKPSTIVLGDSGAPFEIPMKNGLNTTVRKDASGAWIVDAPGSGTTDNFIDNEVAIGSGTSFTLSQTPIAGSQHVYAIGQRLTPNVDYTISGADITTLQSWDAGVILVDYRY